MDFGSALHYLKCGYRIRRSNWKPDLFVTSITPHDVEAPIELRILNCFLSIGDMMANDWELIKDENE